MPANQARFFRLQHRQALRFVRRPHIALDMSNEILRSVNVANEGQEFPANEIASRVEAILLAVTEEEAFKLASVNTEERHGFIDQVARQVRDAVLSTYTVTEIEREQNPPPVKETNGWMSMNASSRMRSRGINGGTPGPETKAMTLSAMTALPVPARIPPRLHNAV